MLTAYVAERLPIPLMLAVAGLLALAASGGEWHSARTLAADAGLALLLVAQFRVWDDLADRERDARTHPHRVLVSAASVMPAVLLCLGLAVVSVTWVAIRGGLSSSVAILLAVNGGLAVLYARRASRTTAGDHVLLAKYPAIVLITAGARVETHSDAVLLAATAVYLGACVYEAWHDRASPATSNRVLVASEAILLVITLVALSIGGRS
jgi:4-hydroxybenzoate polyprenyltransferase